MICHDSLEEANMNPFSDFDAPVEWARLQQSRGSQSDQVFPHLEVAMGPRMASAPVSQEEDVVRRGLQQSVKQGRHFDPMSASLPGYRSQSAKADQEQQRHLFHWHANAAIPSRNTDTNAIEALLQAEPDLAMAEGTAALAEACIRGDCQAVQALLGEGEDVNARDPHGLTALDHAVVSGQFAVAEILSAAGAACTRSRHDLTAVLIPAVKSGLPNLLRYALGAGADITVTDSDGRMPLHHAVLSMRHQFVPCLANAQTVAHADALGNTPLHLAAMVSNPIALKALLDRQAALNVRNREGNTALACACCLPCGNSIMLLVRAGADTALANQLGQHPLHIASLHGQTNHVRMLLAFGADVHVRTAYGESALDIARRGNAVAIVSALMLAGA
jgi:ankyrin repeat protein